MNNMKIALFFKNARVANVDASRPELGNPGFGGRQFMNLIIAHYIGMLEDSKLKPIMYCEVDGKIPHSINSIISGDLLNAMTHAKNSGVKFFIVDASLNFHLMNKVIGHAEKLKLDTIFLLSLIPDSRILKRMYASGSVKCIACVEQFTFELLRDHPAFDKATVITNAIPMPIYGVPLNLKMRKKHVVYMGSLVPQKGFGMLAMVWQRVLKEVPDAKLYVCGLGTLYGKDNVLGKWGVASEKFESESIRPYLSDSNGEPISSVNFLGNVGHDKVNILKKAMVGVANPTGSTETFCLSAVEMQAAGLPVIAGAKDGLFDTVQHKKTGYLIRDLDDLTEKIIYLLKHPREAVDMGHNGNKYVRGKYEIAEIARQWEKLFMGLEKEGRIIGRPEYKEYSGNLTLKFILFNSKIKNIFGSPYWWPSYMDFTYSIRRPIAILVNRLRKYYKRKYS